MKPDANLEERRKYRDAVAKYVTDDLANLNGFELLDAAESVRYRIRTRLEKNKSWQSSEVGAEGVKKLLRPELREARATGFLQFLTLTKYKLNRIAVDVLSDRACRPGSRVLEGNM